MNINISEISKAILESRFDSDIKQALKQAEEYFSRAKVVPDNDDLRSYVEDWFDEKYEDTPSKEIDKYFKKLK